MIIRKSQGMNKPIQNLKKLKEEISNLIKNKNYDQILNVLDLYEKSIPQNINLNETSENNQDKSFGKEMIKSLLDITPTGICILNTEKYFFVNSAWQKIMGYTEKEAYNKISPLDTIHPDMKDIIKERSNKRLKGESVKERYDIKIITKDKITKWIDVTFSKIQFEDQIATLGIFNDITEMRIAQELLAKSEEKYRSIFNSIVDIFYRLNANGVVEIISPSVYHVFGYKPKEVIGKSILDFYVDKDKGSKFLNKILEKGEVKQFEEYFINKSGKEVILSTNAKVLKDSNGKFSGVEGISRDITKQKKAENDIRRSEEKFRKLTELSPAAICIQTTDKFLWANPAWSEISGFPLDEVLDMGPLDIIHPEMKEIAKARSDARLNKEDVISRYNLKILTKDEKVKWVDIAISVIEYEGQMASLAVSTDVTEKVMAQLALKESEEKFRELTELSPAAIAIQTTDRILFVNPAWCQIVGYAKEEALKMSPLDFVHPDMKAILKQRSDGRLDGKKEPNRFDLKVISKDKKVKWINAAVALIDYEGQRANLTVSLDVTEVHEIQQALKESKELYKKLVNNQGEGIVIVDENEKFTFANPAAHDVFGVPIDKLVGRNVKEFLSEKYISIVTDQTKKRIKGESSSYELEITRPDKSKRYILVTASPEYNSTKDTVGAFAVFRDITERKKAEKKVLESEKRLKEINIQKDKFFSLIAHDLRSPIGNFLQISELLKKRYDDMPKEQTYSFFTNLHELADKTFKLLENLLMWSRSQLGKLESKIVELNLHYIVKDIEVIYTENLKKKSISFINKIPESFTLNADYNIVNTILRNLINNAIKFSYPEGTISVNARLEFIDNVEFVIVSVKDTGVGMSKDVIDTIFDMDVDYTTYGTANEKGTGLGIILCKELIEKNGGKIWVGSEEGKGSNFCFTLKR